MNKNLLSLILTVCCVAGGYAFYKVNNNDAFNAIFFTVGILGIMLSVLRNAKKNDADKSKENSKE
jgi:hypothetical protein